MKQNLLSFLSTVVLSTSVVVAQPTLTSTGINPVIGEMYTLKSGASVSPGNSGASQTWTVMPATSNAPSTFTSTSVASTPYAASFSQANFSYNTGGYYVFYNTSATALQNDGSYAGTTLSYSNPEDLLHFPFNMGNTYTDPWATTFVNGGVTFNRSGNTAVTYDGFGTLTLASGTYNNVVRVHFVQTYSDVYSGGTINYNNDEYMWYLNGNHQPIAVTYTITNSTAPSSPTAYSVVMSNITPTSIYDYNNIFSGITSFPNPAVNEINFNINNIPMAAIDIIDISGKNVYSEKLVKNLFDNTIKINTSEFKDGIYVVKFTAEDGQTGTKKISISK